MTLADGLDGRLVAAGVPVDVEPHEAWRRLRDAEGPRTTVLDLYELVARPRSLHAQDLSRAERRRLGEWVMSQNWPGFTLTGSGARATEMIVVVEYDHDWPSRFTRWQELIRAGLGPTARRIEHVGSTSVDGLPAKPIVDIQVGVAGLEDESRYVPGLEALGLQLRSRDRLHRFFRPFPDRPREVHVHVCEFDSDWEREHLLLRDYLRVHLQARQDYAAAKHEAARLWADDRIAYTDAKSGVILDLLERATVWAAGGRRT